MNTTHLNKIKRTIYFLLKKVEMLEIIYNENPTKENLDNLSIFNGKLDDRMDILYSNVIMYLKEENNALFELYLSLPKESVKNTLLLKIREEIKNKRVNEPSIDYYKFNIHTELKK